MGKLLREWDLVSIVFNGQLNILHHVCLDEIDSHSNDFDANSCDTASWVANRSATDVVEHEVRIRLEKANPKDITAQI